MSNDLGALDENRPDGATEQVSILDNAIRETRASLKEWAGIEHDLKGRHKIPFGLTAARPLPSGGSPAIEGTIFWNYELGFFEFYTSGTWVPISSRSDSYIYNGSFEKWWNIGHDCPCGWTRSSAFTLTREATNIKYGSYSLQFTRAGADRTVSQRLDSFWDLDIFRNRYISLSCAVRSNVAGTAYLGVDFGAGMFWSAPNVTTGSFETIIHRVFIPDSASQVNVFVAIRNADATVQFDGITFVIGFGIQNYQEGSYPLKSGIIPLLAGAGLAPGSTYFIGTGNALTSNLVTQRIPYRSRFAGLYGVNDAAVGFNLMLVVDGVDDLFLSVVNATYEILPTVIGDDYTAGSQVVARVDSHSSQIVPRMNLVIEEVPLL